jgi:hypothetical protein
MKLFSLSIVFLIFCSNVLAQTNDELVENILNMYFITINQEKLLTTNSIVTKGKMIQGKTEYHFTSYKKRPMKYRLESEIDGQKVISVVNGNSGWTINPIAGSSDPVPMSAEVYVRSKQFAEYDGIFYNYQEQGSQIEYVNDDYVGFVKSHVLELTTQDGDIITAYFNNQTNVLIKKTTSTLTQGVTIEIDFLYSNYRYVDEILMPFQLEMDSENGLKIIADEIIFDSDIPDSMFEMLGNSSEE